MNFNKLVDCPRQVEGRLGIVQVVMPLIDWAIHMIQWSLQ